MIKKIPVFFFFSLPLQIFCLKHKLICYFAESKLLLTKISTLGRTAIKIVISISILLWVPIYIYFAVAHSKNKLGNSILIFNQRDFFYSSFSCLSNFLRLSIIITEVALSRFWLSCNPFLFSFS